AAPAPAPTAVRPPELIPPMPSLTLAQPAIRAAAHRQTAVRFTRVDKFIFDSPCLSQQNAHCIRMLAMHVPKHCYRLIPLKESSSTRNHPSTLPPQPAARDNTYPLLDDSFLCRIAPTMNWFIKPITIFEGGLTELRWRSSLASHRIPMRALKRQYRSLYASQGPQPTHS